jgi:hypothetical protein
MRKRFTGIARAVAMLAALMAPMSAMATAGAAESAPDSSSDQYSLATAFNGNGAAEATFYFWWVDEGIAYAQVTAIRDICPADQHGAYISAHVFNMDGTSIWVPLGQDANGCGPESVSYWNSKALSDNTKPIRYVKVLLAEKDAETNTIYDTATFFFDNPFTG